MITAHLVTIHLTDEELIPHRKVRLAAVPRVGEFITQEVKPGDGQAFKVLAVVHMANPEEGLGTTVELHIRHVGTLGELHRLVADQGSG